MPVRIAAQDDVKQCPGIVDARFSCHGRYCVNLFPYCWSDPFRVAEAISAHMFIFGIDITNLHSVPGAFGNRNEVLLHLGRNGYLWLSQDVAHFSPYVGTAIFLLTYVFIALGENSPRKLDRPTAALFGAVMMVLSGTLTETEAIVSLNIPTLSVLFGMMVLIVGLIRSGFPVALGYKVLNRCRSPKALLAAVVLASGCASAIMLNDTVCLLGTPLILEMTAQAEVSPAPFLFALTTSANIGSVMTLTGNPQNILIGHASGWSWSAFALRMTPIALVSLIINWLLLMIFFRGTLTPASDHFNRHRAGVDTVVNRPLAAKSGCTFLGLIVALIFGAPMDVAALTAATLLLVWANRPPSEILDSVDWSLLLFFAGLFVVVAGVAKADANILNGREVFSESVSH